MTLKNARIPTTIRFDPDTKKALLYYLIEKYSSTRGFSDIVNMAVREWLERNQRTMSGINKPEELINDRTKRLNLKKEEF